MLNAKELDSCAEPTDCSMIICKTTVADIVEAGIVEGEGATVVPEKVPVIVISSPRTLTGTAGPAPMAVYLTCKGSVAVLGAEALQYMLLGDPLTSVYYPDKRFAKSPPNELYCRSRRPGKMRCRL